ncbi:LAMI_0G15720g1_1 [Lachancea mirantina]|uniref:Mediator of RNA polymerase II transcription subunit 17 n=1 Tax=Lachancea mirantina TaxID=1230905 RepID=A0A1G4KCL3_9SACH|nr:LAMI_0G15720g1_1 [Lachancea mirantina]
MDVKPVSEAEGVPLLLDPNLFGLFSKRTPADLDTTSDNKEQNEQQPATDHLKPHSSLVNNPFETYEKTPLDQLIPLIVRSRGQGFKFADLSEQLLLNEIEQEQERNGIETHVSDNDNDINKESEESLDQNGLPLKRSTPEATFEANDEHTMSLEKFQQCKRNTIQSLDLALNESSLALEFVSLMLSSVRPSAASASMSPYLKKNVPAGTLSGEKVLLNRPSREETLQKQVINKGWKLRSLEEARSLLKEVYLESTKTLEKERKHWSEISHFISNKDVVFKTRDKDTGERSLGFKYGYRDSGSSYKLDRGIAVLKHNALLRKLELVPIEENAKAVHINQKNREKFLRVRIFTKLQEEDDYILTGESDLDSLLLPEKDEDEEDDMRIQIKRLKFFIFEQELMNRILKESEQLFSYGVSIENENKVVIEFPTEKMEVEYVQLNDDILLNHQQDAPKTNDKRARLFLVMMRLLLVVMYKKQLKGNILSVQQSGAAATKNTRSSNASKLSEPLIIRPILGKIRHNSYLCLLKKIIKDSVLDSVLEKDLRISPKAKTAEDLSASKIFDDHISKLNMEIYAFDEILSVPETEIVVDLAKNGRLLLTLQSPNYCNAITTVKYVDSSENIHFNTRFSDFKELEEFLHFIVTEYVN